VVNGVQTMFKAEYVAEVNPELCNGCRQCMRACQFGAIAYSAGNKKAFIDQNHCYGCGVCRASCVKEAIHLEDRASVPAVANLW
ncbi:MAG: 4Fe-4S binding protein, partial [Dehalococcoidales bacterium]